MKKFLLPVLCFAAIVPASAEGLDLQNRMILQRNKMERDGKIIKANKNKFNPEFNKTSIVKTRQGDDASVAPEDDNIRAFVRIAKGFSASDLEDAGMTVLSVKGGIAIVSMPIEMVEEYSQLPCVAKLNLEKKLNANMDLARAASGVDDIHTGKDLKMPYTGKGVLVSVVDQGVDPNHVAFLDEAGKSRVKYLTYFDGTAGSDGYPKTQYYGDEIYYEDEKGNTLKYPSVDKFFTDVSTAYHGTHTLNILAGGYKGDVTVSKNGTLVQQPNSFYGVAPEADIAVSCGDLQDASVALGMAEMIDYGIYRNEKDGMPMVLSLSLGSTAGPHDPNSLMNAYLSACGEEVILCLSAGNEGDLKLGLNKTFTEEDNQVKSMVYPYGFQYDPANGPASFSNTYIRTGVVCVYSNDNTPFQIKAFVMTGEPGNYRRRATLDLTSKDGAYYASDAEYANYVQGSVNSTVGRYFKGYIGGGAMYDEDLGRYWGALDYYVLTNPETGINADGSEGAIIGFEITGSAGQRIDCYCDGENTWIYNYGLEGYQDGSRDGTISDMAIGDNFLVVGAYNTRHDWYALDNRAYSYGDIEGFETGGIGPYSSYGTLADGSTLPHVCAPGTAVMSAFSTPYVETVFKGYENYIAGNTTAKATVNGRDYYWTPETGTSMSTPFVAGGIALWLEADPTLTIKDVYEIIEKTSKKDAQVLAGIPAQWGAGKFDAMAGLKEVISRREAGIGQIIADDRNDRLILSEVNPGVYSVFVGNAKSVNVDVYSLSGSLVYSKGQAGNEATVDLSGLSKGIYVLKANNHVEKIYLK